MKNFFLIVFCVSLFNVFFVGNACSEENVEPLTIYYIERVPYFYSDEKGDKKGIVLERVRLAFEKAGVPYEFKPLPAKRHMVYLQENKEKFCTIGWYKNEERLKFSKYSEPVYQNKTRIALAKADNKKVKSGLSVETFFKNPELILLFKEGYSYGDFIDGKIKEFKPETETVTVESVNMIKMVYAGRGDYFFTSEEEADALIPEAGLDRDDFHYVRFSDMPSGLNRYILYSRKVEDEFIAKVDEAIKEYLH